MSHEKNLKPFLQSDFLYFVDKMAQRYGKLPSEILDSTMKDFHLDSAIFLRSVENDIRQEEKRLRKMRRGRGRNVFSPHVNHNKLTFGDFQIKVARIKKDKQK